MADTGSSLDFKNFDDESIYNSFEDAILQVDTLNVVIEFGSIDARAALNVNGSGIQTALKSERGENGRTRWINVWGPERQKGVVQALAKHYGFSSRLKLLMCTDHDKLVPAVVGSHQGGVHVSRNAQHYTSFKSSESHSDDIESHEMSYIRSRAGELDLNFYRLLDEVWHWCSVDWGSKYLCLGYNSLCNPQPGEEILVGESEREPRDKPVGVRYWTWLILCDDGTVISMHEVSFHNARGVLSKKDQNTLNLMRRNLLNIFRQLSKANDASRRNNPIMTIPIRPDLQEVTSGETSSSDASSLLFHYLFDDWLTTYSLVARQEHQYGRQLEHLRAKMLQKADVTLINDLHHVERQLRVLKRMYQSYALIIDRILDRQKPVNNSTARRPSESSSHGTQNLDNVTDPQNYGVSLSADATVRFERLRDRINLYALSEIQDCLDEKESLVFLNFNLITLRESSAVERLTRITILLAKLTILFLPVSLMTAYFSVQVKGLVDKYDATTYWASFGVIMGLSIIFLVIFGKLSGTLEGKPIYRSITQTFFDVSKKAIRDRRRARST